MLLLLDFLLFLIHIAVISFNLFGWIWEKTRKLHLWIVGMTLTSWLGLGLKYGLGYCFLTDWHWDIKRKLGATNLPNSFVMYIFESLGINMTSTAVDAITLICFVTAIFLSIYFNFLRKY